MEAALLAPCRGESSEKQGGQGALSRGGGGRQLLLRPEPPPHPSHDG